MIASVFYLKKWDHGGTVKAMEGYSSGNCIIARGNTFTKSENEWEVSHSLMTDLLKKFI